MILLPIIFLILVTINPQIRNQLNGNQTQIEKVSAEGKVLGEKVFLGEVGGAEDGIKLEAGGEEGGIKYLDFSIIAVEALNVLLMIIATVTLYPALKFSIYMKCFQTIFCTYLMAFMLFLPLFCGCIGLAYILFDQYAGGQIEEFQGIGNAATKYIIMYAGEINIDAGQLSGIIQVIAMTIIIILIINKANLILSVVINDVQKIMQKSKEYSLRLYAKRYVEFAEKIRVFYATEIE